MQPGDDCSLKADALKLTGLTTTNSDVSNSLSTIAIHNQSTNTDSECSHKILSQTSNADQLANKPTVVRPIDSPFGWIPTLAAMVNFMFIFGAPNSYGVFSTYYLNTKFRDTPAATLSWIGTSSTAFMLGLNIFSGPLADRIGYRQTAYIGTVICTFAYILASFSSKVWQLMLTQGILFGIGASFLLAPSNSIAPQWFDRHRGLASGVAIAGSSIGGLWFTAATQSIIDSMGPEWALRILGILTFVVTSIMNLLYIERVPPTPRKNIFELKVVKQLTFWLIILELFAAYTGYWALLFYIGTSAIQVNGTSQDGADLLLVLNACSAVGRVLLGFVADKFGSLNTLLFCLLLTVAVEMSLWITARSLAPLYVLCTIYGLISSTFISLNPVIVAIYFSSSPLSSVLGMTNLSSGLGGLVGNLSQGVIFDKYDNRTQFTNTIIFSSMFLLLSAVAVLALRVHVIGKGSNKRLLQKI